MKEETHQGLTITTQHRRLITDHATDVEGLIKWPMIAGT